MLCFALQLTFGKGEQFSRKNLSHTYSPFPILLAATMCLSHPTKRPVKARAHIAIDGEKIDTVEVYIVSQWMLKMADQKFMREQRGRLDRVYDEAKKRRALLDFYESDGGSERAFWTSTGFSRTTMQTIFSNSGLRALKKERVAGWEIKDGLPERLIDGELTCL